MLNTPPVRLRMLPDVTAIAPPKAPLLEVKVTAERVADTNLEGAELSAIAPPLPVATLLAKVELDTAAVTAPEKVAAAPAPALLAINDEPEIVAVRGLPRGLTKSALDPVWSWKVDVAIVSDMVFPRHAGLQIALVRV